MSEQHPTEEGTERVEAILRRYGVAERDIGSCCDDLSPHFRPPDSPLGPRYTEPRYHMRDGRLHLAATCSGEPGCTRP